MEKTQEIILEAKFSNILEIENMIMNSNLLKSKKKKMAALIASTEIFCNIVEHAKIIKNKTVYIYIRKNDLIEIEFKYWTNNFDKLLKADKNPKPYLDLKAKRYRGLGLLMVKNLSFSVEYKEKQNEASICMKF